MDVELTVRDDKLQVIYTKEEAKELYLQLRELFGYNNTKSLNVWSIFNMEGLHDESTLTTTV